MEEPKDSMSAVDTAGKAALNFNISVAIYFLVAIPFVIIILAGLAANKGQEYVYPLAIRFIH